MAEDIDIPKIKDLETYSYGDKLTMLIQGGHTPKEGEFDQTDNARRLEKMQQTVEDEFANMIAVLNSIKSILNFINDKMTTTSRVLDSIKSDVAAIELIDYKMDSIKSDVASIAAKITPSD